MIASSRVAVGGWAVLLMGLGGAGTAAPAFAQATDTSLDNAIQLVHRAVVAARTTPLADANEASKVLGSFRTSNDKDVAPLFAELRKSQINANQVYAMVTVATLTKDPKQVDLPLLWSCTDSRLVGEALATLIDSGVMTDQQLNSILNDAGDPAFRVMAAGELSQRKATLDLSKVVGLLNSEKNVVRFYAALTVLQHGDKGQNDAALKTLKSLQDSHDLSHAPIEAMMLVRMEKQGISAALPWSLAMAADEQNDDGLRFTAVTAALAMKSPDAPPILAGMIQKETDIIKQVKLGLIALEFAPQLQARMIDPLTQSHSQLVTTLADLAQQSANGADVTSGLIKLIRDGHPIVLDWAVAYSNRCEAHRSVAILTAVVQQSNIVDDVRGRDYERAALAAEKLLADRGPDGRQAVTDLLATDNHAAVESILGGIYRANVPKCAELVAPLWRNLSTAPGQENAANFAALILAREGQDQAESWLARMVMGATVQNPGFRALAGWFDAKLQGKSAAFLQQALAQ